MSPKAAILIDGAFFLRRLRTIRRDVDVHDVGAVIKIIRQVVFDHLKRLRDERLDATDSPGRVSLESPYNFLYRCFYYDAEPYAEKHHARISNKAIDYAKTDTAVFHKTLFQSLRKERNFALRLGRVKRKSGRSSWMLKPEAQERLLHGDTRVDALGDDDFDLELMQKGVDMRIGIDIAHIALKKQADTIILISGDADFVPAAKLARREGTRILLDSMWGNIAEDLFEHIDGLHSVFSRP